MHNLLSKNIDEHALAMQERAKRFSYPFVVSFGTKLPETAVVGQMFEMVNQDEPDEPGTIYMYFDTGWLRLFPDRSKRRGYGDEFPEHPHQKMPWLLVVNSQAHRYTFEGNAWVADTKTIPGTYMVGEPHVPGTSYIEGDLVFDEKLEYQYCALRNIPEGPFIALSNTKYWAMYACLKENEDPPVLGRRQVSAMISVELRLAGVTDPAVNQALQDALGKL